VVEGLSAVEASTEYISGHGDQASQAAAHRRLAVAMFCAQRPADALAAVDRAATLGASALDPAFEAQVALIRAQCLGALERLDDCAAAAEEAIELYRVHGDPDPMAAAVIVLGIAREAGGDTEAALAAYTRAAEAARDDGLRTEARTRRARLLAGSPRAADAVDDLVDWLNRAVAHAPEADQARYFLAVALLNAGRPAEAAENAEDALTGFEARREQYAVDQTRRLLHAIYRQLEEPDQALAQLDELLRSSDLDQAERGHLYEETGSILYAQDRDALAAQRFDAAAGAYEQAGLLLDRVRALRRRLLALRWAGEVDTALDALPDLEVQVDLLPDEFRDLPEATFERAMLGYDGAKLLIDTGRPDDALVRIRRTPTLFRSIEAFGEAVAAELVLGEVLVHLGRSAEAESVLRRVVAGLPRDSGALPQAAWLLATALDSQGREAEATALRSEYGLTED
jgi:tetratricopeptide (TPR) repeat protein